MNAISSASNDDDVSASIPVAIARRIRNLQVLAQQDGLVVRGSSRTYYDKQLVQTAIMATCDRPILANEIQVTHDGRP